MTIVGVASVSAEVEASNYRRASPDMPVMRMP